MKKLLINEENKELIEKFLNEVRGKEKERLATFETVLKAEQLAIYGSISLLVKHKKGLCLYHSLNEKMPSSYKYKYEADVLILQYVAKGWALVDHKRKVFWPTANNETHFFWNLDLPETLAREEEIKQHLYNKFINLD